MIGISKLYCSQAEESDSLRYRRSDGSRHSSWKKPVVVFNCTRRCNLRCRHCYSASDNEAGRDELTGDEARAMIDDLAAFGCPVLLFSGGEPLLRPDVMPLIAHARSAGMRAVLSTNGTAITPALAGQLAAVGLNYVGISLDGATPEVNDRFRGTPGAFDQAVAGIRHCRTAGLKVGLDSPSTGITPVISTAYSTSSSGSKFPAYASITWSPPVAAKKFHTRPCRLSKPGQRWTAYFNEHNNATRPGRRWRC